MGRPRATSSNREFAVAFVNSVTVFSARQFDWVARKGRHGLFELMLLLASKVTAAQLGPFLRVQRGVKCRTNAQMIDMLQFDTVF